MISGPIPSPGSTAMLTAMGRAAYGVAQSMTDVTDEAHNLREQLEAERQARLEAERLAAENARLLYDRQDELELLEMVAAASNEATAIEPALGAAIVHVCAHMRWPVGHAYLVDPATDTLRPTGIWYLEDEARYAAFRDASEQPELVPVAAQPRHGQRRVGVGDRHRRGAGLPSRRDRPRGGAARGLRLPDPHRHAAGRRARVLHRRPGRAGSRAAARDGPDRRPARAGGRARARARRARALQRRPRGLRLRRLARPGRAAALGRRASSRCSSASTAIASTTARASSSPTRSTASSACSG